MPSGVINIKSNTRLVRLCGSLQKQRQKLAGCVYFQHIVHRISTEKPTQTQMCKSKLWDIQINKQHKEKSEDATNSRNRSTKKFNNKNYSVSYIFLKLSTQNVK